MGRQHAAILEQDGEWEGHNDIGDVEDRLGVYINDVENNRSVNGGADSEAHEEIYNTFLKAKEEAVEQGPRYALGDDEEEYDSEECDEMRKKKKGKKSSKIRSDVDAEQLHGMKWSLREHMHSVRAIGKELTARSRSLRYFSWVRDFQGEACRPECACCGKTFNPAQAGVLSCCGHVGCLDCLKKQTDKEECVDKKCAAPAKPEHIVAATALGSDTTNQASGEFGTKITQLVTKVKTLVEEGDRVLIFVQFADLKDTVAEALECNGVRTLQVKGSVGQQVKALSVMQNTDLAEGDPRVLLLTMDDESSSGVNLTLANHAVFVHPLLADSQQQYDAYETQAIGRIRRYGQNKTCHIWRYLCPHTIDAEIYQARAGIDINAK